MEDKNPNSKQITIFRAGSFLSRAQGKDAEEMYQLAKVSIGSYWAGGGSNKIGSGLTHDEEELLLPDIIDTTVGDRDFRKRVTEFYAEMDTPIPYHTGCTLEIGLKVDNFSPLSTKNMPINVSDYLRYRHAKNHPQMAQSKEESDGNATKQYYIFDKDTLQNKGSEKRKQRDNAMAVYFQIKEDIKKVDMMLTLLGTDPREFTGKNTDDDKIEALRILADKESERFTTTYKEENFDTRAWIKTMVNVGVLKEMGTSYRDGETNKLIGKTLEETIYYMLDVDHQDEVDMYKARTQEASKTPVIKKSRRTQPLAGASLRQ